MKVTKTEQYKKFGPGLSEATIPAGLEVREIPNRPGEYWLDDLSIFPRGSIARHDACHYGVKYTENEVEEKK